MRNVPICYVYNISGTNKTNSVNAQESDVTVFQMKKKGDDNKKVFQYPAIDNNVQNNKQTESGSKGIQYSGSSRNGIVKNNELKSNFVAQNDKKSFDTSSLVCVFKYEYELVLGLSSFVKKLMS